jgi:hypothetical protein
MSASWPVAGNGLRRGAGESAAFPTEVREVVAMCDLVAGKMAKVELYVLPLVTGLLAFV